MVTDIKNSVTAAEPPHEPVPVPTLAVVQAKKPEILTLAGGEVTKDVDQISVALTGTGFSGSCTFIDTIRNKRNTPKGMETDETALLKFFTTKFIDGKLSVPADANIDQLWSWSLTEQ